MVKVDLSDFETLPIPADRASARLPIDRTYTGTSAAPNRGLRVRMDYNDAMSRWTFDVALAELGVAIPRRPVTLLQEYSFRDRILLMFVDPLGLLERVTPGNLGTRVKLVVYPGPESPGWEEWLAEHRLDTTDAEDEGDTDGQLPLLS